MQATRCDWFAEVFQLGVICFSEPATRADKQQRWLAKKVELYRRDLQRLPAVGAAAILSLALCHVAASPDALSVFCRNGFIAKVKHPLLAHACKMLLQGSNGREHGFLLGYENAQSHAKRCLARRPPPESRLRILCTQCFRRPRSTRGASLPPIRSTTGTGFRVVSGSAMKYR
jgi:hypothetical protein